MSLLEAIQSYLSWQSIRRRGTTLSGYEVDLKNFCLWARNPDIEDIEVDDITEYFQAMIDLGWKKNSTLRKATALRELFKFLGKQNYRVLNWELIPIGEREYTLPKVASKEDFKIMLEMFDKDTRIDLRNRALALLLWDSMGRIGEVLSLNTEDINLNESRAIMKTEKNRGTRPVREIFWTEETNEALTKWIEKRKYYEEKYELNNPALFIGLDGRKVGERIHPNSVREIFRKNCEKAGIPYINPHSIRHAGGIDLAMNGANNSTISSLLGHTSLLSSFVYTRLKDTGLKEQWKKFRG